MKNEIKWKTYYGKIKISKIRQFEEKIKFKFPKSYVEIITEYDSARVSNKMTSFKFFSNLINEYEV